RSLRIARPRCEQPNNCSPITLVPNSMRKLPRRFVEMRTYARPQIFVKVSLHFLRSANRSGRENEFQSSSCDERNPATRALRRNRPDGRGLSCKPFDLVRSRARRTFAADGIFLPRHGMRRWTVHRGSGGNLPLSNTRVLRRGSHRADNAENGARVGDYIQLRTHESRWRQTYC